MVRFKTAKYNYPKPGGSLSELSIKFFGKPYHETTDTEARKLKKEFRGLN